MELLKAIVAWILALEARILLRRTKPRVVMITGSVGKTGTKDAIAAAIEAAAGVPVRASNKSLNSEIGVPLAILDLPTGWANLFAWISILARGLVAAFFGKMPTFLVLEAGVDRPGDMDKTLSIVHPEIAVATMFPDLPVHAANFPKGENASEAMAKEKGKLLLAASRVVVGADHARALAVARKSGKSFSTYGFSPSANFRVEGYEVSYDASNVPTGFYAEVSWENGREPFNVIGAIGETQALPIAAAAATLRSLGLPIASGIAAASKVVREPGRERILAGINKSVIIDDSYNSSPVAVAAAVRAVAGIKRDGRLAVLLGDMRELGEASMEAHKEVGRLIAASGATILVTVGDEAEVAAKSAAELGCLTESFLDAISAGEFLKTWLGRGDVLLAKGSQGVRLERAVEQLLIKASDAEFLPRRGKEWEKRK